MVFLCLITTAFLFAFMARTRISILSRRKPSREKAAMKSALLLAAGGPERLAFCGIRQKCTVPVVNVLWCAAWRWTYSLST